MIEPSILANISLSIILGIIFLLFVASHYKDDDDDFDGMA